MNSAALQPAGSHAQEILQLFWLFTGVSAAVYLLVIGFLWYSLRRGRGQPPPAGDGVSPAVLRTVGAALALTGRW